MSSTDLSKLKIEYQKLSDTDKLKKYAKDYGDGEGINRYKTLESYWTKAPETDLDFPDLYQYHFPLFYQTKGELERIFKLSDLPQWELLATMCTVAAYKNIPRVMLLWERRKHYGLKDYTLNTHELLGITGSQLNEPNQDLQKETKGVPDNLRYTMS